MDWERMIMMIRLLNVCISVVGLGMLIASLFIPSMISPLFPVIIAFSWYVTLFYNPVAKELWERWKSKLRP